MVLADRELHCKVIWPSPTVLGNLIAIFSRLSSWAGQIPQRPSSLLLHSEGLSSILGPEGLPWWNGQVEGGLSTQGARVHLFPTLVGSSASQSRDPQFYLLQRTNSRLFHAQSTGKGTEDLFLNTPNKILFSLALIFTSTYRVTFAASSLGLGRRVQV